MNKLTDKIFNSLKLKNVCIIYNMFFLFIHALLLILFLMVNNTFLVFLNICSVYAYILNFSLIQKEKFDSAYYMSMCEVILFSFCITYYLGNHYLFSMYNISIIPIMTLYVYYKVCYLKNNGKVFKNTCVLFLTILIFFLLENTIIRNNCIYIITDAFLKIFLTYFNIFLLVFSVIAASLLLIVVAIKKNQEINDLIKKIDYNSKHDTLTGLLNRTSLEHCIKKKELDKVKYSIGIGDIDDFKKINDKHGHHCGDFVLRRVADIITNTVSSEVTLFRYGGEEFVFICDDDKKLYESLTKVKELLNKQHFIYNHDTIDVTMTFGLSNYSNSFEETLKKADKYLYEGKNSGKNKIVQKE